MSVIKADSELKVLYEVVELLGSLEFKVLLKKVVELSVNVVEADACLIYLLDADEKNLVLQASKNPHPRQIGKISMEVGEGITGWVAKHQTPVVLSAGASSDDRFAYFAHLPEDTFEAFLSVPILCKKKTVGVINVQHRDEYLHREAQVKLMSTIGRLIGQSLQTARLLEETHILKDALELQKIMSKAKGVLSYQLGLSEHEAHKRLQKLCMSSGKSMREVAEAILLTDKI